MDHFSQGFIPGPSETKEQFEKRVEYCLSLRSILPDGAGVDIHEQQKCLLEAPSIYGLKPDWIPLIFSNHKLAPWHGGCAWIFQMDESEPTGAFLQLRKPFKLNQRYLGIYDRKELLSHEVCHVARMAFEEPIYEEHLAYRTSSSRWRRWIGPIIRNSVESMLFFLTLLIVFGAYLFALFVDPNAWIYVPYFYLLPLILTGIAFIRLWNEHQYYDKTLANLRELAGARAEQLMLWLTDKEIKKFGNQTPDEILEYLKKGQTFRLQSLALAYLPLGITA